MRCEPMQIVDELKNAVQNMGCCATIKYSVQYSGRRRGDCVMDNQSTLNEIKAALPEFDFEAALKICMGDEDFYLELFQDFSELPIEEELVKYITESDAKNYCIRIHGFKNNAYSVGAKQLGDLAYEMEKRTKQGSFDGVLQMQTELLGEYKRICAVYAGIMGTEP